MLRSVKILREGVFEKLSELRSTGHRIASATNQTSVANGFITMEEAEKLVENCADKVGVSLPGASVPITQKQESKCAASLIPA